MLTVAHHGVSAPLERVPLCLWIGPAAHSRWGARLAQLLGAEAELRIVPHAGQRFQGPAILVLHTADLGGPERPALLELAGQASPGRPIVLGQSRNRETLLDVINTWRAFRLLPLAAAEETLVDAIRKAHEAYAAEAAVMLCASMLQADCGQLEQAVAQLRSTQARLLHSERLVTVGRVVDSLLAQTRTRLGTLDAFRTARARVPANSRLRSHWESVIEATDSFAALLEDMLALSESRAAHALLRPEPLDPLVMHCVRLFRYDPLAQQRQVVVACDSGAIAALDRFRVYHVMLTLLRHAAQVTGRVDPMGVTTRKDPPFAVIDLEDSGPPEDSGLEEDPSVPPESGDTLATDESKAGMGLRLCRASIEAQGGTLEVSCGKHLRFRIRLPLVA